MAPGEKFGTRMQTVFRKLHLPGSKKKQQQRNVGDKAQNVTTQDTTETSPDSSPDRSTSLSGGASDNEQEGGDKEYALDFNVQDAMELPPIRASPDYSSGSEPPSDGDILSDGIPDKILAFRTITKLLSRIQQDREIKVVKTTLDPAQVVELRISDAFATVGVTEHEVVAVATNQRMHSYMLEAIVAVQPSDSNPSSPLTHASSTSPSSECPIWTFVFNTRWSNEEPDASRVAQPIIYRVANLAAVDPIANSEIAAAALNAGRLLTEDEKIVEYAEQHW